MSTEMNRRSFLHLGAIAGAASVLPRWINAQSPGLPDRVLQGRAASLNKPITTTKLSDNVYLLLQGVGGNMVLQTGSDGNILVDSNFATAVPKIREAIATVSHDAPGTLINTHWHYDHTDGNEGMHAAGFTDLCPSKHTQPDVDRTGHSVFPSHHAGLPGCQRYHPSPSTMPCTSGATATRSIWSISIRRTPTPTFSFTSKTPTFCMWATSGSTACTPSSTKPRGATIGGMIHASEKALSVADESTKIIPGHGQMGSKADLQKYRDMLSAIRDKVATLKTSGASEQEAIAKKPTMDFDPVWSKGFFVNGDVFTGLVYRTL